MNTLIMALRYLRQRKVRTLLTTVAILFGVAVIYGTNAMFPALQYALEQATVSSDNARVTISAGYGNNATFFNMQTDLPALVALPSIEAAVGRLKQTRRLDVEGMDIPLFTEVTGLDMTLEDAGQFELSAGRFLQPEDVRGLVMPYFLTTVTGLSVGDTLDLFDNGDRYEIVGVLSETRTDAGVYIPLAAAQAHFAMTGLVNRVVLTIAPDAPVMALVADLDALLGEGAYAFEGGVNLTIAALSNAVMVVIFNVFAALALFMGGFLIYITFATAVIERKRDLAMLRAIGAERAQVSRLMVAEALIQGALGTLFGLLSGQVLAVLLLNLLWNASYRGFAPPAGVPLHPPALLLAIMVGLLTALAAGYFPAQAAGRLSPLEALRHASPVEQRRVARARLLTGVLVCVVGVLLLAAQDVYSGLAALALLIGAVLLVPVLVMPLTRLLMPLVGRLFPRVQDMIHASVLRQPWRTAATVNLMAIGFAVFTGVVVLLTPIIRDTERAVNSQRPDADLTLYVPPLADRGISALPERLAAVPNVARVVTETVTEVQVAGARVALRGIDPSVGTRMRYFSILDTGSEAAGGRIIRTQEQADALVRQLGTGDYALITPSLAARVGLMVGDRLTVSAETGEYTYTVIGLASEFSMEHNDQVVMVAHVPERHPEAQPVQITLGLADPSQTQATQAQIMNTILVDYPHIMIEDVAVWRAESVGIAQRNMSIFYMLAALVLIPSVLGLVNTLVMNVLERTREIGLLRATGADRRQVRAAVIGEGLLLGLLSAVIGVVVGLGMGYGILTSMNAYSEWSMFTFWLPVGGFALGLLAGLLLIVVATLGPAQRAARLDILSALRYE